MKIVPILLLLVTVCFSVPTLAQKKAAWVSGRVVGENEQPMGNVSVVILGRQKGIATSDSGTFRLQVPADKAFAIVFSFTGYKTEQRNFLLRTLLFFLLLVFLAAGCYEPSEKPGDKKKERSFVFKETIITGKDTGMYSLGGFHKNNIADLLCQHWQLTNSWEDLSSNDLAELSVFKDSTVLKNPRTNIHIGHWRIHELNGQTVLLLTYSDNTSEQYLVQKLRAHEMRVASKGVIDSIYKKLEADGLIHQNMYSDPFHPVNNNWRIAPQKPETDSAIKARVKACVRFYALYYRDNIRRQKKTIDFHGLPTIFEWYRRGIGLPDRADLHQSWIDCFYNRGQALKGYDILRELIVRYEFDWPRQAPNWVYETHSVLEQMYHKL